MTKLKAKKYYVVWRGAKPGIYHSWDECKAQTNGYSGAIFKSFLDLDEAQKAFEQKPWLPKPQYIKEKKEEAKTIGQDPVSIFCDGGCYPNPGPSGTGMAVYFDGEIRERFCGHHEMEGSNNRAELFGLLEALKYSEPLLNEGFLSPKKKAVIYCDSQYAINCVTKWARSWRKNGWVTKKGQPVLNKELIQAASERFETLKTVTEIQKVKGHSGIPGNELADQLAELARSEKMTGWTMTYTTKLPDMAL